MRRVNERVRLDGSAAVVTSVYFHQELKVKFESSGYEIATTADKVCAAPFKHGDRVRHLQRDQVGIIFFGPDSDLDYKVRWEDSSGDSGYVNASGLRAELHGFLWVCTDGTEAECLEKGLFGGATNLKTKNRAGDIARGTPCFLYNITSKKLRGPYAALTGIGEYDQLAWGGKFPCQVRVFVKDVPTLQVPPSSRKGLNSGFLNAARHTRIAALMQSATLPPPPGAGANGMPPPPVAGALVTVTNATRSLALPSKEKKKLVKQFGKLLHAQQEYYEEGRRRDAEKHQELEARNKELVAASQQAPYKLPDYWSEADLTADGSGAPAKFKLVDAYKEGGFNWRCAEDMLNKCIHPTCRTTKHTSCRSSMGCPADPAQFEAGLSPFRVKRMQRLENREAYQRYKTHEANVLQEMQRLPQAERDLIAAQGRRSAGTGSGSGGASGGADPWLRKLEIKNGLEEGANTRYLLHGTRKEHLPAIMKRGLRTIFSREKDSNIYGKGLYFSNDSCKTMQYSGMAGVGTTGCILICRVVIGRSKLLATQQQELTEAPDGFHSCYATVTTRHGIGNHPMQLHDEYIVYNDIECYPEFFLEVECDWH